MTTETTTTTIKINVFKLGEVSVFAEFGDVFVRLDGRKCLVGTLGFQCKGFKPVISYVRTGSGLYCRGGHKQEAVYHTAHASAIALAFNNR